MDLKDIMAIAGKPGLYKFVAQGRNAVIVENIETGKRTSAFATERINSLEEITVFTTEKDKPLKEIFRAIYEHEKENEQETPSHKADKEVLKDFFEEVVPDYDRERVYLSDIKKILSWYHILMNAGMLNFDEEEKKEKEETTDEPKEEKEDQKTSAGGEKEEDA